MRARWALGILAIGLLLSLVGGYFSVQLYRNLRTSLDELLPNTARSVQDMHKVTQTLQSTESLAVLVFSKNPGASRKFVDDFAREAGSRLGGLVSHVDYKIDRELKFFRRREALFLSVPDLKKIKNYVENRLDYEKELYNPLNIFSGADLKEPRLSLNPVGGEFSRAILDYAKFPDGYYANADRTIRVVLLYIMGEALNSDKADQLRSGVDAIVARLKPATYAPDLRVQYTGDVENLIEERASVISDLKLSTVLVAGLVSAAMLIFYRSILGMVALVASVFAGTLVTFGISFFTEGYLNVNSAFLGSIVIGNGINFGIVLMARYFEARRAPDALITHEQALKLAVSQTWTGTLTAALAAGLSYGSLMATEFRGFRQFGGIGLVGMVCCWISAYTLLPALLSLFDRLRPLVGKSSGRSERRGFATLVAWIVDRAPGLVLALTLVGVALSVIAWTRFHGSIIETDTSMLRDKHSMEHGSEYLSRYLDEIFGRYMSPVVVMAGSVDSARKMAAGLADLKKSDPAAGPLLSTVYSLDSFVPSPSQQRRKIEILDQIRALLPERVMARLPAKERRQVEQLLTPEASRPFAAKDLPPNLKARFEERNGSLGKLVLVEPVFNPSVMNQISNQNAFISAIRRVVDGVQAGAPVVGQLPLTVDLVQSLEHDGPRATLYAFISVMLLVILLFRRPKPVLETLLALLLGMTWMSGLILHFGLKINFMNFIALPITFGIGVDYGVNIFQRYRAEGRDNIARVLRGTGGAVALASFTTIIGYSSLLIAGNQGFVSFGRLAVLGEVTCLSGALWGLPAFLRLFEKSRKQAPSNVFKLRDRLTRGSGKPGKDERAA